MVTVIINIELAIMYNNILVAIFWEANALSFSFQLKNLMPGYDQMKSLTIEFTDIHHHGHFVRNSGGFEFTRV